MMRSSNPAMRPEIFAGARTFGLNESMTIQGTVNKCFLLFFLLLLAASWVWSRIIQPAPVLDYETSAAHSTAQVLPYLMLGGIGGFILAIVTVFKKEWARITAPLYAVCEGLVLGGISAVMEQHYPGIVIQAVGLTFGTFFCMLALYKSRVIRVTDRLMQGIAAATGAVFLVYMANFILGFFGVRIPFIHEGGTFGILFSLFVVGVAALNLILDFHIIEQGEAQGADKQMEWYGAFALMVTLIWLYLEILRLLAKMRNRR